LLKSVPKPTREGIRRVASVAVSTERRFPAAAAESSSREASEELGVYLRSVLPWGCINERYFANAEEEGGIVENSVLGAQNRRAEESASLRLPGESPITLSAVASAAVVVSSAGVSDIACKRG